MIEECKGRSYEERLSITGLTNLETRRTRADMLEVFKILTGKEGLEEGTFFTRRKGVTRSLHEIVQRKLQKGCSKIQLRQ